MVEESTVHGTASTPVEQSEFLNAAENAPPGAAVEVVARQLFATVGATDVMFLIADLSGERLIPITRLSVVPLNEGVGAVSMQDSYEGIALRRQKTQIISEGEYTSVYAPVTSRGDAIGVLVMNLSLSPNSDVIEQVNKAAHTLAYVVVANRQHTDLYEWGQRSGPMTLAAEIQRRLIPNSFTCEAGWFTVAGWLEPSTEVAGDTFDYSFDQQRLTLSLTDAMGHSVESALLATVCVAALRNTRRAGGSIEAEAAAVNKALLENSTNDQFVSGLLVDIPLDGSTATFINAGHPAPVLVRRGSVKAMPVNVNVPFGMFAETQYDLQTLDLQMGDRLVLVTDGLLERNAANFDICEAITQLADLHPREFVRRLCGEVREAAGGELADDATILCFDWHDEPGAERHSRSGSC